MKGTLGLWRPFPSLASPWGPWRGRSPWCLCAQPQAQLGSPEGPWTALKYQGRVRFQQTYGVSSGECPIPGKREEKTWFPLERTGSSAAHSVKDASGAVEQQDVWSPPQSWRQRMEKSSLENKDILKQLLVRSRGVPDPTEDKTTPSPPPPPPQPPP